MATKDVAQGLVDLCKQGQFMEAVIAYYSDNIVSVEPMGDPAEVRGIDAVKGKAEWFASNMEVHEMKLEGPYINGDTFAVRFTLDATMKPTGKRSTMDEIAVYTVADDKIVHEQFLYGGAPTS